MVNFIELSPEVVRLAQLRARNNGATLALELARCVAEESVMELDPKELGLVLEGDQPLNSFDAAAAALGVNDIVINNKPVDVRVLDEDGSISICRALVGTSYMARGSLIVRMEGTQRGAVVGFLGPGGWLSAEEQHSREQSVRMNAAISPEFDLAKTLAEMTTRPVVQVPVAEKSLPNAQELTTLLINRDKLIVARQKQMVNAIVTNANTRNLLAQVSAEIAAGNVTQTLSHSWDLELPRRENFSAKVAPKFPSLTMDEVKSHVRKTGEMFGGQPEAPAFRQQVLATLAREQLARRFETVPAARVMSVVEQVLSGRSAVESVKEIMKNKVAVDLAQTIKKGRQHMDKFVAASAQEIGAAFQQMALQPVYATHSTEGEAGTEAINEALELLEAAEIAEQVRMLNDDLTIV